MESEFSNVTADVDVFVTQGDDPRRETQRDCDDLSSAQRRAQPGACVCVCVCVCVCACVTVCVCVCVCVC